MVIQFIKIYFVIVQLSHLLSLSLCIINIIIN